MPSDSKYTNPTGDGYQGVYATDCWSAEASIGATTHVDWDTESTVHAVDVPGEHGIQLLSAADIPNGLEIICECNVRHHGMGTVVTLHPPVLRALDDLEEGEDVRIYEYEANSLTVVPSATDPFVPDQEGDRIE